MIKRREFIRALAVIPAAALVPFTIAEPAFQTGGVVSKTAAPLVGETLSDMCPSMPFVLFANEDGPVRRQEVDVTICQVEPPVDRVYDLPLDDEQSTVRWVHAERELWLCHGADGCLWMPLLDGECKRRRTAK